MTSLSAIGAVQSVSSHEPSYRAYRLPAIDMVRGLVILIMAIDHVRDSFLFGGMQDPMGNPNITAGLFVTRWITHFCAPVFVLLAGVSAGLMSGRKSRSQMAQFLLTRGVWLIFVEVFIVSTLATFTIGGIAQAGGLVFVTMQVIWAIGASMCLLSGLQWLGRRAIFVIGLAIIACHNLLDPIWPASKLSDPQWPLWVALHSQMAFHAGPILFRFMYPLLPWVGVMSLGFGVSRVFEHRPERRNAILLRCGLALTAGFLLIRAMGVYGDPNPWQMQAAGLAATIMDFMNTTKYPPSLDYLLMTLGPAAILCSFGRARQGFRQGPARHVRPGAVRLLYSAPFLDSLVERIPGGHSGLHHPRDDDQLSVLPKRIWCRSGLDLCRLGTGRVAFVSTLPMDREGEGTAARLVA